ncbi:LysM peptidoglycan-binding domain-containing protein [Sulfitobacter sp. S190]|uniref:LysM peptidoglycan-binding domain-containing protein n=1 Tax=Sulfitobacter sp. S190 TaxID=2867022 RepID=UPI0021A29522|nr:LysM peptidoglycan-binding domain-containing protein [Sulfitobacter sp. S190]UWR21339.1 LysM peptidoglycan-binding domain-containing protein [Sulfitobacter sp. S190]
MSKVLAALGGNTGAVLAGGVVACAVIAGAYIALNDPALTPPPDRNAAAPETPAPRTNAPKTPAPVATQTEDSEPTTQTAEDPAPQPSFPSFDEVRREEDGTTVIAGRAEAGSTVRILVDGEQVAETQADGQGGFAALATLPASPQPQVVTLSAQPLDADTAIVSSDEIILTPRPAVDVAATAAPDMPAPVPTQNAPVTAEAAPRPAAPSEGVQTADATAPQLDRPDADDTAEQVAVLQSDAQGVRLLNTPSPEVMTNVAIDTIGYSDVGDVQLAGRAQDEAVQVRVYLDNASVITLPVGADGRWQGDLPDVDEGIYTLRVDEVTPDGRISSRVETPFKRESAQTLAQASLSSTGPIKAITVQKGATLWAIARDRYGDGTLFVRVFDANSDAIRDPDLIYPGQVFDLPD